MKRLKGGVLSICIQSGDVSLINREASQVVTVARFHFVYRKDTKHFRRAAVYSNNKEEAAEWNKSVVKDAAWKAIFVEKIRCG